MAKRVKANDVNLKIVLLKPSRKDTQEFKSTTYDVTVARMECDKKALFCVSLFSLFPACVEATSKCLQREVNRNESEKDNTHNKKDLRRHVRTERRREGTPYGLHELLLCVYTNS